MLMDELHSFRLNICAGQKEPVYRIVAWLGFVLWVSADFRNDVAMAIHVTSFMMWGILCAQHYSELQVLAFPGFLN